MTKETANSIADWHACRAIGHYHRGEFDAYAHHIRIADRLRRLSRKLS